MAIFENLQKAINELKRDPSRPVQAEVDELEVELSSLTPAEHPERLGDFLSSLGPWGGESLEELLERLREARKSGGSSEPPRL